MTMTPEEPSNVVALNASVANRLEITKKQQEQKLRCYGLHKRIVVDSDNRTVECEHCGRVIDPFEYLEQWAIEGERKMDGLKRIEIQRRIAQAEFYDLERKIKNLRAQLKRKGHPQPPEERQDFNSAMWNPMSKSAEELLRKHSA